MTAFFASFFIQNNRKQLKFDEKLKKMPFYILSAVKTAIEVFIFIYFSLTDQSGKIIR